MLKYIHTILWHSFNISDFVFTFNFMHYQCIQNVAIKFKNKILFDLED